MSPENLIIPGEIIKTILAVKHGVCPAERILFRKQVEDVAITILLSTPPTLFTKNHLKFILEFLNCEINNESIVAFDRFKQAFSGENRKNILANNIKDLRNSILHIFWREDLHQAEEIMRDIKGAKNGYITMLLYLKNRKVYNLMLPRMVTGFKRIFPDITLPDPFHEKYLMYNQIVQKLKLLCNLNPQDVDLILTSVPEQI